MRTQNETMINRPCRLTKDEIKRSRDAEVMAKVQAVKAARIKAVAMRAAAREARHYVVQAKVAAVKAMKANVTPQADKRGVKSTKPIKIKAKITRNSPLIYTPVTTSVPTQTDLLTVTHTPVPISSIVTTSIPTYIVPPTHTSTPISCVSGTPDVGITPLPKVDPSPAARAARIRDIKAARAAKARAAIAALAVAETARVNDTVNSLCEDESVIATVMTAHQVKIRRAEKASQAAISRQEAEQVIVNTLIVEVQAVQKNVDLAAEEFRAVGRMIKRVKANLRVEVGLTEVIESETDVIQMRIPRVIQWYWPSVTPVVVRRRRISHRRGWRVLLYEGLILRVGSFICHLRGHVGLIVMS